MNIINNKFPRLSDCVASHILGIFILLLICQIPANAAQRLSSDFNHDQTGFVLTGPHARLECNACHIRGIFKGLPRQCAACHERGSQIGTTQKPLNHVATTSECESCHAGPTWTVTGFDHSSVTGRCGNCHNGVQAQGKPHDHVASSNTCDDCHLTVAWVPARFDHSNITGSCFNCHNGTTATGKPPTHIASSNTCDNCHSTNAWAPARFDHSTISSGCFNCHNGSTARGKHPNHIQSNNICEDCHNTNAWTPARFDHDNVTGSCTGCHNGSTAEGKDSGHFITSLQCDNCHRTTRWTPDIFSHSSTNYPGDHAENPRCRECHTTNSSVVVWQGGFTGTCAGCHASDFEPGPHKKSEVPVKENYTVGDLQNCSTSSCHFYENGVIKKSRPPGEHSVNRSGW